MLRAVASVSRLDVPWNAEDDEEEDDEDENWRSIG